MADENNNNIDGVENSVAPAGGFENEQSAPLSEDSVAADEPAGEKKAGLLAIFGPVASLRFTVFKVTLDIKRLALLAAVAALCAASGIAAAHYFAAVRREAQAGGQTVAAQTAVSEPASSMPYNFGEAMYNSIGRYKAGTDAAGANSATDGPAEDTEPEPSRASTLDVLYPGRMDMLNAPSETNRWTHKAWTGSGTAAATQSTTSNEFADASEALSARTPAEGGDTAVPAASDSMPTGGLILSDNPTFEAHDPFPITVLNTVATADILISGRVRLTNRSQFTVENAYFLIELDYGASEAAPVTKSQYAYVRGVNLEPGGTAEVTFAAIPPEEGNADYTVKSIALSTFDSHMDGEPVKIYNDTDNAFLEVLADGVF